MTRDLRCNLQGVDILQAAYDFQGTLPCSGLIHKRIDGIRIFELQKNSPKIFLDCGFKLHGGCGNKRSHETTHAEENKEVAGPGKVTSKEEICASKWKGLSTDCYPRSPDLADFISGNRVNCRPIFFMKKRIMMTCPLWIKVVASSRLQI